MCANCGATTARHTFCGNCGISLHALPKRRDGPAPPIERPSRPRPARPRATPAPGSRPTPRAPRVRGRPRRRPARRGRRRASSARRPTPPPDCQPGHRLRRPAAGGRDQRDAAVRAARPRPSPAPPAVADAGIRAGAPWRSSEHAYEFEYSDWWAVDSSDGRGADLLFQGDGDARADRRRRSRPPRRARRPTLDHWFGGVARAGRRTSRRTAGTGTRSSGPSIGFVDGIGQTYAGSKTSPQGATSPIGVSLVTASDGRTTAAVDPHRLGPGRRVARDVAAAFRAWPRRDQSSRPSAGDRSREPFVTARRAIAVIGAIALIIGVTTMDESNRPTDPDADRRRRRAAARRALAPTPFTEVGATPADRDIDVRARPRPSRVARRWQAYALAVGDPASPDYRALPVADAIGERFGLDDDDARARSRRGPASTACRRPRRRRSGRRSRSPAPAGAIERAFEVALRDFADADGRIYPRPGHRRRRSRPSWTASSPRSTASTRARPSARRWPARSAPGRPAA